MTTEIKNAEPTPAAIAEAIALLTCNRRPRPVVTRTGKRARGYVPSFKQCPGKEGLPKFESLVEEDVLRVLEVASSVLRYITHPYVLELSTHGCPHHYTPDGEVSMAHTVGLLEAKGDYWLSVPSSRDALMRNIRALKALRIPLFLLLGSDVREGGLQEQLKLVLRERPVCSRRRTDLDPTQWDPRGLTQPTGAQLRLWRDTQKACDALLDRVIRRDPDEVFEQALS